MSVSDTNDTCELTPRSEIELAVPTGYTRIRFLLYVVFMLSLGFSIHAMVILYVRFGNIAPGLGILLQPLLCFLLIKGWNRVKQWSLIVTVILGGGITIGILSVIVLRVIGEIIAGRPGLGGLVAVGVGGLVFWFAIFGAFLFQSSLYHFFWRIRGMCPLCKQSRFKGGIRINKTWKCPQCGGSVKWVREVE